MLPGMIWSMKLFVWDLHGTLEQGNEEAVVEISNMALKQLGYTAQFTSEHGRDLYGKKWYEYFAFLLPEEAHEKHLELQDLSFAISDERGEAMAMDYIQPARNALQVLATIANAHQQILISNTRPASVPLFIKALGMQAYFDERNAFAVDGHDRHVKRTKQDVLREYLEDKQFDDIIVIGDSAKDMELAEAVDGKGYLYAHAYLPFRSKKGYAKIQDLANVLVELD